MARAVPLLKVGWLKYASAVPLFGNKSIFLQGIALIINQRRVQNMSQTVPR